MCTQYSCVSDYGATLNVEVENMGIVLEGDNGEATDVEVCFTAQVEIPLGRDAYFIFNDSSRFNSAIEGRDYIAPINFTNIVISGNFSGNFSTCVIITVLGNDVFDGLRKIVVNVTTESPLDRVTYSNENRTTLVISINEDDGECDCNKNTN